MRSETPVLILLLFLTVLLCGGIAKAVEPLDFDRALVEELVELRMTDYVSLQLDLMLRNYPEQKDAILVEKARSLYASGKSSDADAALKLIDKKSPYYVEAILLSGQVMFARKNYEGCIKAYAPYFAKGKVEKNLPNGRDENAVKRFRQHVIYYSEALKKLNKVSEAQRIIGLLNQIKGGSGERENTFLKLRTVLDVEEAKLDARKDVNIALVEKTYAGLAKLQFITDGIGALSYIECARAQVLIGGARINNLLKQKKLSETKKIKNFISAIQSLKSASGLLEKMEQSQGGGGELLAGALYYMGKAYRGQGIILQIQKKEDKAQKLIERAALCFEKIATDFGDTRFQGPALTEHAKCSGFAKQNYGKEIELKNENVDGQIKIKLEQAHALYQKKNYKTALPIYMEAMRIGRRSKRLPSVISPLVVCLVMEERYLEAEALASYLVEILPKDEQTAMCVLRLGVSIKQKADQKKDEILGAQAISIWEQFIEIAPTAPEAPPVSYAIAEHYYKIASDIARSTRSISKQEEKEARKKEARDAFLAAIPKYQRVVDNYSAMPQGIRSLYKLAWCYYETDQPKESADLFLRYAAEETNAKYNNDRLEAKFRGAECILFGENPEEAVAQFEELQAWTGSENDQNFNANSKKAKELNEAAAMDIGYSYDLTAEKIRPALNEVREKVRDQERSITRNAKQVVKFEDELKELKLERERDEIAFRNLEEGFTKFSLEFGEMAKKTALERSEISDQMSAEERAQAEKNLAEEIKRFEKNLEEQAVATAEGAKGSLEAELQAAKEKLVASKNQQAENAAKMVATTQAIARLKKELSTTVAALKKQIDDVATAERMVVKWEAEQQKTQTLLEQERTLELDPNTPKAEKRVHTRNREKLEEKLEQVEKEVEAAHRRKLDFSTDEFKAGREALEKKQEELTAELAKATTEADELRLAKTFQEKDQALYEAVLVANAAARQFNEEMRGILAKPVAERKQGEAALRKTGQKAFSQYRNVQNCRIERIVIHETNIRENITQIGQNSKEIQAQIQELEKEIAPLEKEFKDLKEKGIAKFKEFLAKFPKSDKVPSLLAKLGSVYLELEMFEQAESILNNLATKYPQSEPGKQALFNLSRAQFETGKFDEAAKNFERLFANAKDIPLGNLQFIGRNMIEHGQPKVALLAGTELLRRSAAKNHPDYEKLQDRALEPILFRTGTACLEIKNYGKAIELLRRLIEENSKTPFFYEAKFMIAEALSQQTPPDFEAAEKELIAATNASDNVTSCRARYLLGKLRASMDDEEKVKKSLSSLRIVVDLSDLKNEASLPWIEGAAYEAARASALLGRDEEVKYFSAFYRKHFPKGKYLASLKKLPAAKFSRPAPPTQP